MSTVIEVRPLDADGFEQHRPVLLGLAYRMLGSWWDAEQVLAETWLRWHDADRAALAEPRTWLVTVATRLALDQLRAARHRRETYPGTWLPEPAPIGRQVTDPAETARQRETLSLAALRLMERLTPPERAAYLLRETFDLPYAQIAQTLGVSEEDARRLHERAADHLGEDRARFAVDTVEHRLLAERFLAAAASGDRDALEAMLAEEVVLWSDGGGRARAALNPVVGAPKVARFITGVANAARVQWRVAEVNGGPAAIVATGTGWQLLTWETEGGHIVGIQLLSNPEKLGALVTHRP